MGLEHKLETMGKIMPASSTTVQTLFACPDGILMCYGKTVPSDNATGYATGCIFIHTDASSTGFTYVNEGTASAADFNYVAAGT